MGFVSHLWTALFGSLCDVRSGEQRDRGDLLLGVDIAIFTHRLVDLVESCPALSQHVTLSLIPVTHGYCFLGKCPHPPRRDSKSGM